MDWIPSFELSDGDERRIETPLGDVSMRFRDGAVHYRRDVSRPDGGLAIDVDDPEPVERTVIVQGSGKKLEASFLPSYSDRPIVLRIEEEVSVPPGENGFFCLQYDVAMGVNLLAQDHMVESILPHPRKNSYWGPPNDGLLSYEARSGVYTDPGNLMDETEFHTAVVPIFYKNRRPEGHELKRILVPTRELDLYRAESGDLVFEVVEITHQEDFYQEPRPIKRPPKELKSDVTRLIPGPDSAQSLFEKVRNLPRLDMLTSVFLQR